MSWVFAVTEFICAGTRRRAGDRFRIPTARVEDLAAAGLVLSDATAARLWEEAPGRVLTPEGVPSSYAPAHATRGAIRVLQLTHYDPGSSVYRYHSAANAVPGVLSAFVRFGHSNPHCDLRQWDGFGDLPRIRALLMTADVVHCHMDYRCLFHDLRTAPDPTKLLARTYHGSIAPGDTKRVLVEAETDAKLRTLVLGARPYHHRLGVPHWLPIPIPVRDYAALALARGALGAARPLRVAHSPTVRANKGTDAFLAAIDTLRGEGVPIEAVLIEGMKHGEALRLKATCDVTFDSFWLGVQGSGLEAGAMHQAVVAGDPEAQADLTRLGLPVPWTVANDAGALLAVLRRLATDPGHREAEAARMAAYVTAWHSYEAVGTKYREILDAALRARDLHPSQRHTA
jgi:hypothetical protein